MFDGIEFHDNAAALTSSQLRGFFEGWPRPPSAEDHLQVLRGSSHVVMALDSETGQIVGFVTAVSDGVMNAFVPLLEVLPARRGQGLGREMMRRLLADIGDLYSISLHCDPDVEAFYAPLGFQPLSGMTLRHPR